MKIIHPFSNLNNTKSCVNSADGYYIREGNNIFLDALSGLYNCPLGYSANNIKEKMTEVLYTLPNSHIFSQYPGNSQTNTWAEKLTESLQNIIPFSKYVFYTNSGSEAVDSSISLCKLKTKKEKIISYSKSYHGSTSASLSISGNLSFNNSDHVFVDFFGFDNPMTAEEYVFYIEEKILEEGPENILAFVVEPMIGASGGFIMKENILPALHQLLKKYDIFFILDEVISGFGRLEKMFAWQLYNVEPDIVILSKSITNGYIPLSAVLVSFDLENKNIPFGYTNSANPVACAAALECISTIESLFKHRTIDILSQNFSKELKCLSNKCYKIDNNGLFASLHFSEEKNRYSPYPIEKNIGGELAKKLKDKGIIVRGNPKSLILSPGYLMTESQIEYIISEINKII